MAASKPDDSSIILGRFFTNENGQFPSFVDAIDSFEHVKIVRLKGRLDSQASGEMGYFFKKVQKSPGQLDRSVLLDFRKVESVETTAIAQLLKILTLLKKKNYRLGLFNVPEIMSGMLEVLKLENVFQIFDSKAKAYKAILEWSHEW